MHCLLSDERRFVFCSAELDDEEEDVKSSSSWENKDVCSEVVSLEQRDQSHAASIAAFWVGEKYESPLRNIQLYLMLEQ